MNRRRFIGSVVAAGLFAEVPAEAQTFSEPFSEDFPLEKEALAIAGHLNRLFETHALPGAHDVRGVSPLPARYKAVADGVARAEYSSDAVSVNDGLLAWIESLGPIRSARFYVLPDNLIRFEVAAPGSYRVGTWKMEWAQGRLTHFVPIEETLVTAPAPLFREITGHALANASSFHQLRCGIPYWRAHLDAASGIDVHGHNGIAVGDIDNDGIDEIYVCQPAGLANRLYKNRHGVFEDITDQAGVGVLDPTSSALFVDLRNAGRQDLIVLRPDGPLLFLNLGDGRFEHKPGAFRFRTEPQGSFTGMAAADYDRDGRVDLYLCTYSFFRDGNRYRYPTPYFDAQNGPANFLFRNELAEDGSGSLTDATEAAGLNQNNNRFSFAPAWCDYNGDGWPDLYVSNDFGRKNLYKNEQGRFRDVAAEAGVEDIGDGMSASWFDYDGDGRPDLYVSNMWSDAGQRIASQKHLKPEDAWKRHAKGNSLFRNRGDGMFEETGAAEGVEMGRWAWASDGVDFDNDGTPEIFIACGMLTNSSETDLESFFWRKVAAASPDSARPDAVYEKGWNDLSRAVHEKYSEAGRQPNVFYARRGDKYHDFSGVSGLDFADDSRAFAVTDLEGDGNLDLILKSRLGPQVRVFQNRSAADRAAIAFRLRGVKSNRDAIGARVEVDGQVKFVAAGSGYLSQHTKVLHFGLGGNALARRVRIIWPSGAAQEFHDLMAGHCYEIVEGVERPSSKAFAARADLPESPVSGNNETAFADTWLLTPIPLPEASPGPGFLRLSNLSGERAALYSIFCRYLFDLRADVKLPVWFLVDESSRAHKIYFSPPPQSDLQHLKESNRLVLALPGPGRFYSRPERNYAALGAAFFAAGFPEQALRYLREAPQDNAPVLFAMGKLHLNAQRWSDAKSCFEKGLTLSPDSADGWNSLGAAEVGAGHMKEATGDFERALALQPEMLSALLNAGQAQLALGNRGGAEQFYRRALAANPDDAVAANLIGELLGSREWFERAIKSQRDYAPAIANLAASYESSGQKNDAVAALRYGIEVAPDEESLYLNLAGLYVRMGNRDSALVVIDRLLERKPNSARAKQARRELESR
jgi:tetratricopeptide (TPR) repeat protein